VSATSACPLAPGATTPCERNTADAARELTSKRLLDAVAATPTVEWPALLADDTSDASERRQLALPETR